MLPARRRKEIEKVLGHEPFVEVKSLAARLDVSEATVRRDLAALEQAGRLSRTRGGAMRGNMASDTAQKIAPPDTLEHVTPFAQRAQLRAAAKTAIGQAAAGLMADGQSLLLAGGTTPYAAAQFLRKRRVSVVTNSLPAAALLGETLGVDVLVTGGMVYPKHDILIGPQLQSTLQAVHAADWLLLSASGADENGFYDSNHWEVEAQRALMARAGRVALLLDASKFERRDMVFVADWNEIDILITDAAPSEKLARALEKSGTRVLVAKERE